MKIFTILAVVVVLVAGIGLYFMFRPDAADEAPIETPTEQDPTTDPESEQPAERPSEETIGTSVQGRDITAYHYGTGEDELLFIGGIHGGYSWNTTLVAYELMDYLEANEGALPDNLTITVIPVMNPDGLQKVVDSSARFSASDATSVPESTRIAGRFNARTVDLNRNFDCDWSRQSTWQSRTVSGGTAAFSEPEAAAIRDYVTNHTPTAVVVWYSAAGGVFASSCHNDVLPETTALTNLYAKAANYKAYESFDFYEITGDMVNWFAKEGIPAISVLLSNHTSVEWNQNRAAIEAMIDRYAREGTPRE